MHNEECSDKFKKKCPIKLIINLLESINTNLILKVALEEELLACLCPVEPPPEECDCFATGGGTGILPNDTTPISARGERASLGFNACPGCNFRANVTFSTMFNNQAQVLFGRDLLSLECLEDNTIAIITGSGTFGSGTNRQDVTFILKVNETLNAFSLTIKDLADVIIFDTGTNLVPLTGQGVEIRDCPLS